jgi:hypothetical protein
MTGIPTDEDNIRRFQERLEREARMVKKSQRKPKVKLQEETTEQKRQKFFQSLRDG